jgi:PAS domain S-box-containing protein
LPERYRDGHVELRNSYLADPHVVPHGIGREFLARRRDGSEFPFELSLSPIEGPGEARVLALVADISERRMAGHQRLLLSMAVDNIAESVVITDTDGIVEYVNPAFQRMTGYSREEAVGANANILNSGEHEDAFFEEIWAKLKAGETCTTRFINRRKDGSLYEQETTISPVRDVAGMLTHYVSAGRELA